MNWLGALLVVGGFVVILHVMRLVPKGVEVASVSRAALAVVRDPALDDDAKAARLQRQARRLFALFLLLTLGGAAALLVPVGLIHALDGAGLMSFAGVMATLVSWPFLLAASLGALGALWALARRDDRSLRPGAMKDLAAKALFVLALLIVGVVYGFLAARLNLFPNKPLTVAYKTARDLGNHWENDLGLAPTRQLNRARLPGEGVTVASARAQPGLTLLAGFFEDQVGAILVENDGTVVQRWPIRYTEIWPKREILRDAVPLTDWNVFLHGIVALPNGSIVFNFDAGESLVKMNRCGRIVWKLGDGIHHSIDIAEDGSYWVPLGNNIAQISPSGERLRIIDPTKMIRDNELLGLFFIPDLKRALIHPNDVEVLSSEDAPAFPLFEAGDLVYSMREVNLIMVFDPDTLEVKWWQHGPWLRQHDPDFLPDGTISIFNNRMGYGYSNITAIDPVTRETRVLYESRDEPRFYTGMRGKHQHLANGDILITSTHEGRAFEVTPDGEIVWQYINRYDADRVAVIAKAHRYDRDYFTVEDWSDCG